MPTMLPPPQYDHPPEIPVIERVLPWEQLQTVCLNGGNYSPKLKPGQVAWGCSKTDGKICMVWLPARAITINGKSVELEIEKINEVRRHEHAHCNGWPSDHPSTAELARRLQADRAAHHREIEKDAAANAAADAAERLSKPTPLPPAPKTEAPIAVIKVRPADDIAPVHPWLATLGPGGIFLSLYLIDGGEIKHCSQVKAPTSSEPAKSYGEFKTMAECTAESDKRNALSAQKLWGPWRWLCAPPGKLSPA